MRHKLSQKPGWPVPVSGCRAGMLRAALAADMAAPRRSEQELADRSVRRGRVQAVVREAYEVIIAEQDGAHRKLAEFTEAWRARLASMLEQDSIELAAGL